MKQIYKIINISNMIIFHKCNYNYDCVCSTSLEYLRIFINDFYDILSKIKN